MASSNIVKGRRMVWTGAVAAITIVGTLTGAMLRSDRQAYAAKRKIVEATPEQQIEMIEQRKAFLRTQKAEVEKKLSALHERMAEKARAAAETEAKKADG